jgi:regulatory protein
MNAETKERALKILEKRDVSRRMLIDKLREKNIPDTDAEEVADWLCSLGVINDERFAALVVRHYAGKGYGKRRISEELYRRGIDRELWETAFEELPETEDTLQRLLCSRLRGDDSTENLQRAQNFLLRRGYSWSEIHDAVDQYFSGKDTP